MSFYRVLGKKWIISISAFWCNLIQIVNNYNSDVLCSHFTKNYNTNEKTFSSRILMCSQNRGAGYFPLNAFTIFNTLLSMSWLKIKVRNLLRYITYCNEEITFLGKKYFQFPFNLCIVMTASQILLYFWSNLLVLLSDFFFCYTLVYWVGKQLFTSLQEHF